MRFRLVKFRSMREQLFGLALTMVGAVFPASFAHAEVVGQPYPWQTGFQAAASPVMEQITGFHDWVFVVITVITLFVLCLMIYVMVRFRASANPKPTKTVHNSFLEVAWTVIPVLILVFIAIPSFRLLYYSGTVPEADMTLKTTSYQWYWSYEYPDHGGFTYDAFMVADEDLEEGQPRLLATDYDVVLPVGKTIRVLVAADPAGVIHSWAVPSLGVKMDSVPGRLNETWLRIDQEGMYYGQCSELCGVNHGFMPIAIRAVSQQEFDAWVIEAQEEFAQADSHWDRTAMMRPDTP